jgi:serine/threonine protein kinase
MDDLDAASLTSYAVGTLGYIPSEIAADPKQRSAAQDIYACGVMLYEVFAGRLPDPLNYAPLSAIRVELRPLDAIVRAAISGVGTRTRSASDFASQLSAIRREGQVRDGTGALAQASQVPIGSLSTADVPLTLFDAGSASHGLEAKLLWTFGSRTFRQKLSSRMWSFRRSDCIGGTKIAASSKPCPKSTGPVAGSCLLLCTRHNWF